MSHDEAAPQSWWGCRLTASALQKHSPLTLAAAEITPETLNEALHSSTGLLLSSARAVEVFGPKDSWPNTIEHSSEEHVYAVDELLALTSRALKRSCKRVAKAIAAGEATIGVFESSALTLGMIQSCYICRNRWMASRLGAGVLRVPKRARYVSRLWSERANDAERRRALFVLWVPPGGSAPGTAASEAVSRAPGGAPVSGGDVAAYLVTEQVGLGTVVCVDGIHDYRLAAR